MISLLYQFMPLDLEIASELPDSSEHRDLLRRVDEAGKQAAAVLNAQTTTNPLFGTVKPRNRWAILPFGGTKQRIYKLDLYHELWLGEDGKVYRSYVDLIGSSYFMQAELHLRDNDGLRRVLYALQELAEPAVFDF